MGQYYYPTIIRNKGAQKDEVQYYAHDYDNGLKLTEHSYIGNNFVETVIAQLYNNPGRLFWCGDYANKDDFLDEEDWNQIRKANKKYSVKILPDGSHTSSYPKPEEMIRGRFILNHTKKLYIDMEEYEHYVPKASQWMDCPFHPIPLLTAVGNGRGGGDYSGINEDSVGIWAGDLLETQDVKPNGYTNVSTLSVLHFVER